MTDTPLNGRRVSLEKSFRLTANADLQRNIVTYLKVLRSQRYSKLLSPDNTDNVDRLIGELRVIQKLLDVLELGSEPLSDSLLMSQSS
jgi:hypothetical protein